MARQGGRRRRLAGAALVTGVALACSSVSWACTVFSGKMTITGNVSTGISTVVGNNQQMTWCPGYPMGKAKASRGGSITINVKKAGPDQCVAAGSRLPQGVYDVNYTNGAAFYRSDKTDKSNTDFSRGWLIDCMTDGSDTSPNGVRIGRLTLDAFGKGTASFPIPSVGVANGPTDESAICISDTSGLNGLQAPLTVI